MLHTFDWLILHYFLQLIFGLTPLTSAVKSNENLVNQTLYNTVFILDVLQKWIKKNQILNPQNFTYPEIKLNIAHRYLLLILPKFQELDQISALN